MLENKLSRGWRWVGGVLDQMKIRLTQPSFTETGAWAELGNKQTRDIIDTKKHVKLKFEIILLM